MWVGENHSNTITHTSSKKDRIYNRHYLRFRLIYYRCIFQSALILNLNFLTSEIAIDGKRKHMILLRCIAYCTLHVIESFERNNDRTPFIRFFLVSCTKQKEENRTDSHGERFHLKKNQHECGYSHLDRVGYNIMLVRYLLYVKLDLCTVRMDISLYLLITHFTIRVLKYFLLCCHIVIVY